MDLIIKNGTIVSPTATFKADVCVDNGKIVAITAVEYAVCYAEVVNHKYLE